MGPKKKEQEIDINSLPPCTTLNALFLCRGRQERANAILELLNKTGEKYITKITKAEVLEHAKEKNIYIDPNSLTDKQKKDPKFMETVNTQLTAAVVAKATHSLLDSLRVKVRLEKKANEEKQGEAKPERKYDMLYWLVDFPESTEQFEDIATAEENLQYVVVIDPKVSWANAPELPEEEEPQQDDEPQEEDQEIKEYKQLLKKEEITEEDSEHQKIVDGRMAQIKTCRQESDPKSAFRNCTVSVIEVQIDPYSHDNSLNEAVKLAFDTVDKLHTEYVDFEEWRKERQTQPIDSIQVEAAQHKAEGSTPLQLLDSLALSFNEPDSNNQESGKQAAIDSFLDSFSTSSKPAPQKKAQVSREPQTHFVASNEFLGPSGSLQSEVRNSMKYPGKDRHMMPEIPMKSSQLRKMLQSHYSLFLDGQKMEEFTRKERLLNFEEYIKDHDEQRSYSFADRVYEQHHNSQSLQRQLYRAGQLHEHSLVTRYDEATDKLYLMYVYKNNPRRVSGKQWQSSWKVIPGYEAWLQHFKGNDVNLANTQFYDIDAEKIGCIEEQSSSYTLKNGQTGAVVVRKQCKAANKNNSLLYALKNDVLFGVNPDYFYAVNGDTRIYHNQHKTQTENGTTLSYQTVIRLPASTLRLTNDGNVTIYKGSSSRTVTPGGYSIIYKGEKSVILHPNGGITIDPYTYTNPMGYGLKDGKLYKSQTLKRRANNGEVIKREDGTVIVNTLNGEEVTSKWIQFYDGSEYQVEGGLVKIEREGEPFVACENGSVTVTDDEVEVKLYKDGDSYSFLVDFKDGTSFMLRDKDVSVSQEGVSQEIKVDVEHGQISSSFDDESVEVSRDKVAYTRKGKTVDATEDEEKYGEEDTLPQDYIEPRLFVVGSDCRGVELLSENAVNSYLKKHQAELAIVEEEAHQGSVAKYMVTKLNQKRGKQIHNKLQVDLDIFSNTQAPPEEVKSNLVALRTLLKFAPLSAVDIEQIQRIRGETEVWRKQTQKEDNQFGHRPKDDEVLKAKISSKLQTIKQRQTPQPQVDSQSLLAGAQERYEVAQHKKEVSYQKERRESELRRQSIARRGTIVTSFKPILAPEKKVREEFVQIPEFVDHYFLTIEGKKALSEMPDWVFRPKSTKPPAELDPEIQNQLNNTTNLNREEEQAEQQRERYDTVEVHLDPHQQEKEIFIKPSVFTQRQIDEERFAFETEKKAYKYHQVKRKGYNVYGQERRSKPDVPTLLRTQPISEINQKYLVTEAPLDKKIKISSMKNKLTSSASGMAEMRKEGPHTLLMKTMDKGNDINRLLERRTMMVQADLNDKLQRDVLINPVEANFGTIVEGKSYELKIDVKNEDIVSQRIAVKRPKSVYVKAQMNAMGPLALGMTRKVHVTIKAVSDLIGRFSDEFEIVTKHEIYKIPITAQILPESQSRNESLGMTRGVYEVPDTGRKPQKSFELPKIK